MRRAPWIVVALAAVVIAAAAVVAVLVRGPAVFAALAVAGAVLAALAAGGRRRLEQALVNERAARVRYELLARVGRLLEAPPEPEVMLEEIVRIPVPDMAELCSVDLVEDGEFGATWAHAVDSRNAELLLESRAAYPLDIGGPHPVAIVARTAQPHLQPEIGPERLRAFAVDEEHLRRLLEPGYGSSLAVPMIARGRTLGVLSFLRFGAAAPYADGDAELAGEIARRAALALDNARLFAELRRAEGQLEAALGNLAAAVAVQARDGSLVYVNRVAAEMVGCASPDEVLATPAHRILDRFVLLDERGESFDLADLPGSRALSGRDAPPVVIHAIVKETGQERWVVMQATPVHDDQGEVVLAVNIVEDVTDARLVERQQRFLSAASMLLSSSLDVDVTLDKVAWAAVPEVADWCCVDVPDERGILRRVGIAAADAERAVLDELRDAVVLDPHAPESPAHGLLTGKSLLISDFDEQTLVAWTGGTDHAAALRVSGTRSVMVVPMTAGERVVGLITLGTSHSRRRLDEDELALAEELGRRAGIAVENARVHAARSHIATTLQRSLLPPSLPAVPGVTTAARFRAAGESTDVGGDFYDLFPVGEAWMVVVGDVTGKGPEAAAITSLARYTMRTAAMYERSPAAVLGRLNEALATDPQRRQLCTAVCARIEPRDDGTVVATIARGGHPAPFFVTAAGPQPVGTPGPLLGAFDDARWEEHVVRAAAGDVLLFYTDGVTDTRGEDDERFGAERLASVLDGVRALDADAIAARIDDALRGFERGQQRDDVALLVLQAAARPSARRESARPAEPSIRR